MNDDLETGSNGDLEPKLAELADQITQRLLAGEIISDDECVAASPEYNEPIRRLLPALRSLVSVGGRVARRDGVRARRQREKENES